MALSSTEAEYMAAVEAGKEILWMRNILGEFGYPQHGPSPLHIDNQSAISVSKNPEHFGRMKHLDLRFFWLRDVVDQGAIGPVQYQGPSSQQTRSPRLYLCLKSDLQETGWD